MPKMGCRSWHSSPPPRRVRNSRGIARTVGQKMPSGVMSKHRAHACRWHHRDRAGALRRRRRIRAYAKIVATTHGGTGAPGASSPATNLRPTGRRGAGHSLASPGLPSKASAGHGHRRLVIDLARITRALGAADAQRRVCRAMLMPPHPTFHQLSQRALRAPVGHAGDRSRTTKPAQ